MNEEEKKVIEKLSGKKNETTWNDTIRQIKREEISDVVVTRQKYITVLLNLIEKQQKEIKENKENWILAQNEVLGYAQGYKDGKQHKQTATAMIVENRQYQIIEEEIKRYKIIIEKQQKEIEELKKHYKHEQEYINGEIFSAKQMHIIDEDYISKDKIKEIQGQLCMQLGSYVRNEANPEQERIAGGINIINKILKEV